MKRAVYEARAKMRAAQFAWDGKGDRPAVVLTLAEYEAVEAAIAESVGMPYVDSAARLLFMGWPVVIEPA